MSRRGPERSMRARTEILEGVADKTWCLSKGECFRGWGSRPGIQWPIKTLSPGSWQDYYTWRGLSLDSPMAVLLTYPLTVYYVITHLVPQSCKECTQDWRVWGMGMALREPLYIFF